MPTKWEKVIDPATGKSKFVQVTVEVNATPINQEEKGGQSKAGTYDASAKLFCACGKQITGRVIQAINLLWHPDCFACSQCNRQFEVNSERYAIKDGHAWCAKCIAAVPSADGAAPLFYDLISFNTEDGIVLTTHIPAQPRAYVSGDDHPPISLADLMLNPHQVQTKSTGFSAQSSGKSCSICGDIIHGPEIRWEGKDFHQGCFRCGACGEIIDADSGFTRLNDKPMHKECERKTTAPRCPKCREPVVGKFYNVKETRYHVGCFTCTLCSGSLADAYVQRHGFLYCGNCKKGNLIPEHPPVPTVEVVDQPVADPAPSTSAAPSGARFCGECGTSRVGNDKFCGNCGTAF